jgi:hypothetical protein
MFVRFRRQGRRLNVSLIETRRVAGKVVTEHVGALGSVDAAVSTRERPPFGRSCRGASATASGPTSTLGFTTPCTPASQW